MQHAREVLQLTNIIGLVLPENIASQRVLEKLGLSKAEEVCLDGDTTWVYREPGDERSLRDTQGP